MGPCQPLFDAIIAEIRTGSPRCTHFTRTGRSGRTLSNDSKGDLDHPLISGTEMSKSRTTPSSLKPRCTGSTPSSRATRPTAHHSSESDESGACLGVLRDTGCAVKW